MDEETKAFLLTRIDDIESNGLEYLQRGETHRSKHFDLTPLKQALQQYIDGYDNWNTTNNWAAMDAAWMVVGKAQRDVPAHIAQEYCRPGRSFSPTPQFNEAELPRTLTFYNPNTGARDSWFPLPSPDSGLGFDFALTHRGLGAGGGALAARTRGRDDGIDLAAIARLDEERTIELALSRENLNPPASPGMSM